MRVVFRTDASLQIGTGHVMRCLTLADALKTADVECHFLCRDHDGNLIELVQRHGYAVHTLPSAGQADASGLLNDESQLAHAGWLGTAQVQDADDCAEVLSKLEPEWLVVDHYALDARWESNLRPYFRKLMVIDDLADRPHVCDLLLDQNLGRQASDYKGLVPDGCTVLAGPQYALLRPQFAALRAYSLQRRKSPQFKHLLITMGGVDKDNITGQVLEALRSCELPEACKITVVMGPAAPWLDDVRERANMMLRPTSVRVAVDNMAQLMADSDLAIGAAGSTSWERCCLGLPTIMLIVADNQRPIARGLEKAGAAKVIVDRQQTSKYLSLFLISLAVNPQTLIALSKAASEITDGCGMTAVLEYMGS